MHVMEPQNKWTDERLDDLNTKVDVGFGKVESSIRELRGEMNERFSGLDARFDSLQNRVDSLQNRFDSLQKSLFWASIVIVAALIGGIGTSVF
jgi:predicted nuclease with TOPRIM domain